MLNHVRKLFYTCLLVYHFREPFQSDASVLKSILMFSVYDSILN